MSTTISSPSLGQRLRLSAARLRGGWRQARAERWEAPYLRDFERFYDALPRQEEAIFLFFTSGLLHWVHRALAFVPPEVNAVLLGSALEDDEIAWVKSHSERPFHHIPPRIDDNTALEFISRSARHDVGWLHIDCFVLDPSLFGAMFRFPEKTALNCIWSQPGPGEIEVLHSAFVTLNHRVREELRRDGLEISPMTYNYEGSPAGRTASERPLYSRVPDARQVELLAEVVPRDARGLPTYCVGSEYFEILEMYQLLARARGYGVHKPLHLVRDGSGSASSFSNEILHVSGVSTYRRYKEPGSGTYINQEEYLLLLQADFAILRAMGEDAPPRYGKLGGELAAELAQIGLDGAQVEQNLVGFLMSRGISQENCLRILGKAEGP